MIARTLPLVIVVAIAAACTSRDEAPPPAPVKTASQTATATAPPVEKGAVDPATGLVKDTGYAMVAANCTGCHSAQLVTQNRGDRAYWEGLIRWMQKTQNLWAFDPAIEDQILTYLAKNYGPKTRSRRAALPPSAMPPPPPVSVDDDRVQAARAAVGELKKGLKSALMGAMPAGPASAITACQAAAPALTEGASGDVVTVGRTSHKLRNPSNAGPGWARALSSTLRRSPGIEYLTTSLDDGALGYVERIDTLPLCTKCHGSALAPETKAALTTAYPEDRAVGFAVGEMRGAFWARVAASASTSR